MKTFLLGMSMCSCIHAEDKMLLPLLFKHNVRQSSRGDWQASVWTDRSLAFVDPEIMKVGFRLSNKKGDFKSLGNAFFKITFSHNDTNTLVRTHQPLKDIGFKNGYREVEYAKPGVPGKTKGEVLPDRSFRETYFPVMVMPTLPPGEYKVAISVEVGNLQFAFDDLVLTVNE